MLVLIGAILNSFLKIKYKIINGEPTRNPTKHTPLTLETHLEQFVKGWISCWFSIRCGA